MFPAYDSAQDPGVGNGFVLLCQAAFRSVESLVDAVDRAVEHRGDLAVREALPAGEAQDLLVTIVEQRHRLEHMGQLLAHHDDLAGVGFRWPPLTTQLLLEPLASAEPTPVVGQPLARHRVEPGKGLISGGKLADPPPCHLHHLVGRGSCVGRLGAPQALGQHIVIVTVVDQIEPGRGIRHRVPLRRGTYTPVMPGSAWT